MEEYRTDPVTRKFNPLLDQSLDELRVRLLREHYLVNGTPADEAIYGILRGEVGE